MTQLAGLASRLGAAAQLGDDELDWIFQGSIAWLAILVALAIVVAWFASRRLEAARRPGPGRTRETFDLSVVGLAGLEPTPIALATPGPIKLCGSLHSAVGSLGGPPERACVYRNARGASRRAAVASELVLLADDTGRAALLELERARVIAPHERLGAGAKAREWTSLFVGDRVEVVGWFAHVARDLDGPQAVYGSLGSDRPFQITVLERDGASVG